MKRHALTATLKDDEEARTAYLVAHRNVWPDVVEAGRRCGVNSTSIYRQGNSLFMFLIAADEFSWEAYADALSASDVVRQWQAMVDQHLLPAGDGEIPGLKWRPADEVCHVE